MKKLLFHFIFLFIVSPIVAQSIISRDPEINNMRVRVFSEGVPAYETERMAALRRYTSGENDGKARQLARYFFGIQSVSASGHESLAVFPGRAGR